MPGLLSVVTGTENKLISEATVKKISLRVILEYFHMPATKLLGYKDQSLLVITTYDMLSVNTVEGN